MNAKQFREQNYQPDINALMESYAEHKLQEDRKNTDGNMILIKQNESLRKEIEFQKERNEQLEKARVEEYHHCKELQRENNELKITETRLCDAINELEIRDAELSTENEWLKSNQLRGFEKQWSKETTTEATNETD